MGTGLSEGGRMLRLGLVRGATGIVQKPFEGASAGGVSGFLGGLGKVRGAGAAGDGRGNGGARQHAWPKEAQVFIARAHEEAQKCRALACAGHTIPYHRATTLRTGVGRLFFWNSIHSFCTTTILQGLVGVAVNPLAGVLAGLGKVRAASWLLVEVQPLTLSHPAVNWVAC